MTRGGIRTVQVCAVADQEAIAAARHRGTRTLETEARLVLGRVPIPAGTRREEVQAALDSARSLVEETGAKSYPPFIHLERAALARAAGDEAARGHELRAAHRLHRDGRPAPCRAGGEEVWCMPV
jgi:D-serine deaminase-like pyridoxal phosphate-dependent protein